MSEFHLRPQLAASKEPEVAKHPLHKKYPNLLTASANIMQSAVAAGWADQEAKAASLMFDEFLDELVKAEPATRTLSRVELAAFKQEVQVRIVPSANGMRLHFKIDGIAHTPVLKRSQAKESAKRIYLQSAKAKRNG